MKISNLDVIYSRLLKEYSKMSKKKGGIKYNKSYSCFDKIYLVKDILVKNNINQIILC